MEDNASLILVFPGATLTIDSARLSNANVKILPEGRLILTNNGVVELRKKGGFMMGKGAKLEHFSGKINIPKE